MRRYVLYALIAAVVFVWSVIVFRSCSQQQGDNPLSKAKSTIEDTASGLSSNDDSDEFEGGGSDSEDATLNNPAGGSSANSNADIADTEEAETDAPDETEESISSTADELAKRAVGTSGSSTATNSNASGGTATTPTDASNAGSRLTDGRYIVVAGSFNSQANANTERDRLKRLGYNDAEVFRFDHSDFYSVGVGRYNNYQQASSRLSNLKKDGIESYIHRKRNK